ncbi:MAG: hypothetical protein O3A95_08105 [Planctomycetota bacterium]|nr:hypothetical protein [Planctomycetota bacterium]MDA1114245.1 hypothetical protein [Planctomycetota bacterium]
MRKLILLIAAIALASFAIFALRDPVAFRRSFVMQTQMDESRPGVFLRSDLDSQKGDAFLSDLALGQALAREFFGTLEADPIVAFADQTILKERFAVGNPFASSYFHNASILVVIAPRGNNPDVMAHALAHAEVKHRLGEKVFEQLPAWFDEGVCTQLDHREFLSAAVLEEQEAKAIPIPSYSIMAEPEWFQGVDGEDHLVFAKREVRRWIRLVGREGVLTLLDRVAAGEDFMTVYRGLELDAGA